MLDWKSLLAKTDLKNKRDIEAFLVREGYENVKLLDNLPGRYGQPWLYGNGTTVVVAKLRQAIQETNDSIPIIDEAIKEAPPEPEPKPELDPMQLGDTLVTSLDIEGVTKRQLAAISESGIETLADLFENEEALEQVPGVGEATKDRILQAVTEALEKK